MMSFSLSPFPHPSLSKLFYLFIKEPGHFSCRVSYALDFANWISMLSFIMFLCPLYLLKISSYISMIDQIHVVTLVRMLCCDFPGGTQYLVAFL